MPAAAYLSKWNKVPAGIKKFILSAISILVIWKVLYLFILLPTRVLDKPLSTLVAKGSVIILNLCSGTHDYSARNEIGDVPSEHGPVKMPLSNIYFKQTNVVSIEDGCNGLELFVLYGGFIVCLPASRQRKWFFIPTGILLIFLLNTARCAALSHIHIYYPKYIDFAHHYVFTFLVYGFIIGLWLLFTKNLTIANDETK